MIFRTVLLSLALLASSASAKDILDAFHDLHKQNIEMLFKLQEKALSDHQRLLLNDEFAKREGTMSGKQLDRLYANPGYKRSKGNAYGHQHAPGQAKKHGGKH